MSLRAGDLCQVLKVLSAYKCPSERWTFIYPNSIFLVIGSIPSHFVDDFGPCDIVVIFLRGAFYEFDHGNDDYDYRVRIVSRDMICIEDGHREVQGLVARRR